MIDFRYHLVSIIAVFFALAVGIVLGAGPLGERIDETLPERLAEFREENNQLREQIIGLGAEHSYQEAFVAAVAEELVGNRLDRRDVMVVALPAADENIVDAVSERLQTAGATVTATVAIDPSWTDQESEAALDALAAELVASGTVLPEDGTGYERGAAVLAGALLKAPDDVSQGEGLVNGLGDGVDVTAYRIDETALAGFSAAEFIEVGGDPENKASLAVVVAGPAPREEPAEEEDEAEAAVDESWTAPLASLVGALGETGAGTVVAGPRRAAEEGELLHVIRTDGDLVERISTVDQANLPSGQIAIVYAVVEQGNGGVGQYGGVAAADGALPPVPPRVPPLIEETQPEDGEQNPGDDGGENGGTDGVDPSAEEEDLP